MNKKQKEELLLSRERYLKAIEESREKIEALALEYLSRPPRGLRPKWIVQEHRANEIQEAVSRYNEAKKRIPLHWIEEYNDICKELKENESDKLGICEYMITENNESIKL